MHDVHSEIERQLVQIEGHTKHCFKFINDLKYPIGQLLKQ